MWVGVDDTDSVRGGCTTHVLTELVATARDRGIDLIGFPRLVRLNPNIPWKTRGNAALSARFGHGHGPRRTVGEVGGRPVVSYAHGSELGAEEGRVWVEAAWSVVRRLSQEGEANTDPALVATRQRPHSAFYWKAVREVVPLEAARESLAQIGAEYRTEASERGLIGALASIAWLARARTYELLSYRRPEAIRRPRQVDASSVRRAQRRWPSLFLCYDPRTRRLMVSPHTPCPILFGLRSRSAASALRARRMVRSEPVDRWLLFATNQGTGDHLRARSPGSVPPYTSARVMGTVVERPTILAGGHVRFSIAQARGGSLECLVFEPTKTLPAVARSLVEGDRVRVWGSRGDAPPLRLEGIEVLGWNPLRGPRRGPRCPACDRRAGSMGRMRGYRCERCGRRWPPEAGRAEARRPPFPAGTFHPTPSARRHLAPLGPEPSSQLDL